MIEGHPDVTRDNWTKGIYGQINNAHCDNTFTQEVMKEIRLTTPLETDVITTHPAEEAYRLVLEHAGCSIWRDCIDERIVYETRNGTATYTGSITPNAKQVPGLIDIPNDVRPEGAQSAWPELADGGITASYLKDSDGDGMPDTWETSNGLNPHDTSDGTQTTLDKEGYTNLEVYMNSLTEKTCLH